MTARAPAPRPSYRLIPSRFPPISAFDTVATAADLASVMELEGWTNDRLVAHRIARLPQAEWAHGRANASVIMAAFLHAAPTGGRFNTPDLGAWYAAAALATAAAEVAHHLRREMVERRLDALDRDFRCYSATLVGEYVDIRGRREDMLDVYASESHAGGQAFASPLRQRGEAGILYDSLRHAGGICVTAFRPSLIQDVVQGDHFAIAVEASSRRIEVRRLTIPQPAAR